MRRFLACLLLLVLVLTLTLKMKLFLGWAPDFVFVLLIVFGFILNFPQTVFLVALAAWIMNWQPLPGLELWIMAFVALLAYFGRYFMPFERWLSFLLFAAGGLAILYAAAVPHILAGNARLLILNILGSTLFGFVMLWTLRFFYREELR
jgi:hypothetical protein